METQTPSSSTPPQLSQSPKPASHHKLLKMLLIIVAFMLIAVIGTSAYVGYQANQQVVDIPIVELGLRPVSTPTIDETDGWVTYINKDLGISFQYPQNSRINPSYDTSIYSKNTFMELFNDEYDLHFSVSYVDNLNNLSLEELDSEIHKKEEEEGYEILSPNLFSTD
ncbi:hypothetical protein HY468_05420, partial [Candidatus Roizmanbacteria bacterium]|nr:hypothetical protein [Candidatus Roizmanbacteria bacterium]